MLTVDATELAMKISQTWRGGPQPHIWEEELVQMHGQQARIAYEKLRRSSKSAPSVAEFIDAYEALGGTPLDADTCSRCRGLGWVDCEEGDRGRHAKHCRTPDECLCTAQHPCACEAGDKARIQFARIERERKDRRARSGLDGPPPPD